MYRNWIARYYDGIGKIICTEKFYNRTEGEAENEAIGLMPDICGDWTLIPLIKKDNLKININENGVDIYINNGEGQEQTFVCYWNIDEVKEEPTVIASIANAIKLFYTQPKELFSLIYGEVEFE